VIRERTYFDRVETDSNIFVKGPSLGITRIDRVHRRGVIQRGSTRKLQQLDAAIVLCVYLPSVYTYLVTEVATSC
jgi:hypothetical protein